MNVFGGSFAIIFIMLAVYGTYLRFSPVPYWDMWDGYLGFFLNFDKTNWISCLWQQHNEHRIVLSRILFLADFIFFGGYSVFLIIVNHLLTLAITIFFVYLLKKYQKSDPFLIFFTISCVFFWCQNENLTWAFQSQFYLVQLLPLLAFYMLYLAQSNCSSYYFFLACLLGILSVGTMANGILVLPFMTLYSYITKFEKKKVYILFTVSICIIILFFHNYSFPIEHGVDFKKLIYQPFKLFLYTVTYLGNPFYYILGVSSSAPIAGLFLLLCSSFAFYRVFFNTPQNTFSLFLLFFIFFIAGSAASTGSGRLIFGISQALSSRYTTTALMAWVSLVVIYAPSITKIGKTNLLVWIPFCLLLLGMASFQLNAASATDVKFRRDVSALALVLGVRDEKQIKNVYPNMEIPIELTKEALLQSVGVWGSEKFRSINDAINVNKQIQYFNKELSCKVEHINFLGEQETRFVSIEGRIESNPLIKQGYLYFLDQNNSISGACITRAQIDPHQESDNKLTLLFKGYIPIKLKGQMIKIYDPTNSNYCLFKLIWQ